MKGEPTVTNEWNRNDRDGTLNRHFNCDINAHPTVARVSSRELSSTPNPFETNWLIIRLFDNLINTNSTHHFDLFSCNRNSTTRRRLIR